MKNELITALENENAKFNEYYIWLKNSMADSFFDEVQGDLLTLVNRTLIDFELRQNFAEIYFKRLSIVLCLEEPGADLRILERFRNYGIKNYVIYVSKKPLPRTSKHLRIALIYFTEAVETIDKPFPKESEDALKECVLKNNPDLSESEFNKLMKGMNKRFLNSLKMDLLTVAIDMFCRAKTRDTCQYQVIYNKDWKEKNIPSLQIVFAWRNTPKYDFIYQLAHRINCHGLSLSRLNATYIDPYAKDTILIMALGLDGPNGLAAWEVADIDDFLKELVTAKYFAYFDLIGKTLVSNKYITANFGNFLRCTLDFIHQILTSIDLHLYTHQNCEEALCRHPELTIMLCKALEAKFHPTKHNLSEFDKIKNEFYTLVSCIDTGNEINDLRRKNVLKQGMNFIEHILKTNFYQNNKTAFSFRLNSEFLDYLPTDRQPRYPVLPYGVFFIANQHFVSFHVRFEDLARGGVRTIFPVHLERSLYERNTVFSECYNLALTQNKKNKDIPEGGAKAVIYLSHNDKLQTELPIMLQELTLAQFSKEDTEKMLEGYKKASRHEWMYEQQRSFVRNLLILVNGNADGTLHAKNIVDYWKKPEYLYLGPDENMHDVMIEWIAKYSVEQGYRPGGAFISGKPEGGINHKEYGVTSLGVNIYMEEVLKYLGIDPRKDRFTIKIAGGPDGDVAGNEIMNLYRLYPDTAKITALTDVSGTINDPEGLDLSELAKLFKDAKPIRFYPAQKLHEGGFLLDKEEKKEISQYEQQTLLIKKKEGALVKEWLSGSEMNHLFRTNVHSTKTDIFIPAGGRPRTLNEGNYKEFLDESGNPTSKGIIEGANLYLTPLARRALEDLGVILIKDSSANKTGVICSSFEILSGLTLSDAEFSENKAQLVKEILEILKQKAFNEARLLLRTYEETKEYLSEISEHISERINTFFDQLMAYLETVELTSDPKDFLNRCFLAYCPPILRDKFQTKLLTRIPDNHKKACIACYISSRLVYSKGLGWSPTIIDVLPTLLQDISI